jgi:hypothetical protein
LTYAASGLRLSGDELPYHPAVVLEFAATEPEAGLELRLEHRAGLELQRRALHDATAPCPVGARPRFGVRDPAAAAGGRRGGPSPGREPRGHPRNRSA